MRAQILTGLDNRHPLRAQINIKWILSANISIAISIRRAARALRIGQTQTEVEIELDSLYCCDSKSQVQQGNQIENGYI